jgi:hypothetical protein
VTSASIYTAPAGSLWVNDTGAVAHQLLASLVNTCPRCILYHLKIAAWWPIPLHPNCRCAQLTIMPGETAPFVSQPLIDVVKNLPHQERDRVLGKSLNALVAAGLIPIGAVVLADRIKHVGEAIHHAKLTDAQLETAGVRRVKWDESSSLASAEDQRRELAAAMAAHTSLAGMITAGIAGAVAGGIHAAARRLDAADVKRRLEEWKKEDHRNHRE